MTIAETLLLDYDAEIQNTRRILERIPEDKPDWKPHDKSMPMGRLAVHVARLPMFGSTILTTDELDMATAKFPRWYLSRAKNSSPNSKKPAQPPARPSSPQPTNTCSSIGSSASATKSSAMHPAQSYIATMFLNHLVHHRGQLTVYLRLNEVPVPGLYGPSADEQF